LIVFPAFWIFLAASAASSAASIPDATSAATIAASTASPALGPNDARLAAAALSWLTQ
jgi:hypothetical protein